MAVNSLLFSVLESSPHCAQLDRQSMIFMKLYLACIAATANVCVWTIFTILLRRTTHTRVLEDRYLECDPSELSGPMQETVQVRKDIVRATENLRKTQAKLSQTLTNMEIELHKALNNAYARQQTLQPEEKSEFVDTLKKQLKVAKMDVFRARETMAIHVGRAQSLAKAQRDEEKKELKALSRELKGLKKVMTRMQRMKALKRKHRLEQLTTNERIIIEAEDEEAKQLSAAIKFLYKMTLSPSTQKLKDIKRHKFMFPRWVQYVVYALILAAIILLQLFVILFNMRLNACANDCDWVSEEGEDGTCEGFTETSQCDSCRCSECGAGTSLAESWLEAFFTALALSWIFFMPLTELLQGGVVPALLSKILKRSGFIDHMITRASLLSPHHASRKLEKLPPPSRGHPDIQRLPADKETLPANQVTMKKTDKVLDTMARISTRSHAHEGEEKPGRSSMLDDHPTEKRRHVEEFKNDDNPDTQGPRAVSDQEEFDAKRPHAEEPMRSSDAQEAPAESDDAQWVCPATGTVMPLSERANYLKTCKPYQAMWLNVFKAFLRKTNKKEVQSKIQYLHGTPAGDYKLSAGKSFFFLWFLVVLSFRTYPSDPCQKKKRNP